MSFRAPRRVCFDGNEGMIREGLHPPRPAVRINNNLLLWSSVSYPSRDRADSFSSTLRRRRNMGELDRRSGIGLCDWQLFSAMQKTSSSDRCKKTGTNSRSCMSLHNRLPDARGERHPAGCLDRNLTAVNPPVHLQRGPTTGFSK